jgi:hypothetical protein
VVHTGTTVVKGVKEMNKVKGVKKKRKERENKLQESSNHKTKPSFAAIRKYASLCALYDHDTFRP